MKKEEALRKSWNAQKEIYETARSTKIQRIVSEIEKLDEKIQKLSEQKKHLIESKQKLEDKGFESFESFRKRSEAQSEESSDQKSS